MTRRMLAVAHELTRTGAPMNLLHLLRWVREHTDVEVTTLSLQRGPLLPRFEAVGPVVVLDRNPVTAGLGFVQSGLQHLGSSRAWRPIAAARLRPQLRDLRGFDLVYLNSLRSISVLPYLPEVPPAVAHAHELQVAYRTWNVRHEVEAFRTRPDRWIAASDAVRDLFVDEVGLPADRVSVHHEFIDARAIADRVISPREVEACRLTCGIPHEAAVVVGAGTIDWRKGADLFVQLAVEVRRQLREPVHFVWVGGDLAGTDWERLRSDRERAGADHVHFVGTREDPAPWFAMADVFALTSREDPFPLVCLESAALGVPIVTYRNGGIPELLEAAGPEAAAGVVDHLDVMALTRRTVALVTDSRLRDAAGDQLRRRVLAEHDVGVAAPELWKDLEALMEAGPAR